MSHVCPGGSGELGEGVQKSLEDGYWSLHPRRLLNKPGGRTRTFTTKAASSC